MKWMRQIAFAFVSAAAEAVVVVPPPPPIWAVLILPAHIRMHAYVLLLPKYLLFYVFPLHNCAIVDLLDILLICSPIFSYLASFIDILLKLFCSYFDVNAISLPLHSIHSILLSLPLPLSLWAWVWACRPVLLTESPVWKLQFTVFNLILDQLMNPVVQNYVRSSRVHVYVLMVHQCAFVYGCISLTIFLHTLHGWCTYMRVLM